MPNHISRSLTFTSTSSSTTTTTTTTSLFQSLSDGEWVLVHVGHSLPPSTTTTSTTTTTTASTSPVSTQTSHSHRWWLDAGSRQSFLRIYITISTLYFHRLWLVIGSCLSFLKIYINVNKTIHFQQSITNIPLSQMVTGCRFTSADPRGMKMLDQVSVIFTQGAKVIIIR